MSRKPSTLVTFGHYPPLPTRSWSKAIVQDVCRVGRDKIRVNFDVQDDPRQAGPKIHHDMPAILAPGSLLFVFLNDGFGIELSEKPYAFQIYSRRHIISGAFSTAGRRNNHVPEQMSSKS